MTDQFILQVPYRSQSTLYTCGAVSTGMCLEYFGILKSEKELIKELKITPKHGTYFKDIEKYIRKLGLYCEIVDSFDNQEEAYLYLKKQIKQKAPVIITVDRYVYDNLTPKIYTNTDWESDEISLHIVVVIGFDNTNVYIHDPHKDIGASYSILINNFLKAWFNKRFQGELIAFRDIAS